MNSQDYYNEAMICLVSRDFAGASKLFKEGCRTGSDGFYYLCFAMYKYLQAPPGSENGEAVDFHMALRRFVKAWLLQEGIKDNVSTYYFAKTAAKIGMGTTSNKVFPPILQTLYGQLALSLFALVEDDNNTINTINGIEPIPFIDIRDSLNKLYIEKVKSSLTQTDVEQLIEIITGHITRDGVCQIFLNTKNIALINNLPTLDRIILLCHYISGMLFNMSNIDDDICNVGKYR